MSRFLLCITAFLMAVPARAETVQATHAIDSNQVTV
jgi:hypothetical protein